MKKAGFILLLGMCCCIMAGCEKSSDNAWEEHYTMPPSNVWEDEELKKEDEWHVSHCENEIEMLSLGGTHTDEQEAKITYEARNDKSKIYGYRGEFIFYYTSDNLTKNDILRESRYIFTVLTEANKNNYVQLEICAKDKDTQEIKERFWLRYADKHREKMVIYIMGDSEKEGVYLTDEEWLEKEGKYWDA